ncbi:hypothetical protein HMPREF9120_00965 [Neisseria sp. oral taxon 020 str. F0370]|nr:hypothetical protein HMPREF9120_00965 [Neisseria sp. oral taxon 020 str. F0370]
MCGFFGGTWFSPLLFCFFTSLKLRFQKRHSRAGGSGQNRRVRLRTAGYLNTDLLYDGRGGREEKREEAV